MMWIHRPREVERWQVVWFNGGRNLESHRDSLEALNSPILPQGESQQHGFESVRSRECPWFGYVS